MKQILTVFSYTFKEGARKKAFIISTIIIMVLVFLLCLAPKVVSMFQGGEEENVSGSNQGMSEDISDDKKDAVCYMIDNMGIFENSLDVFKAEYPNKNFLPADAAREKEIRKEIRENEDISLILIEENQGIPFIRIVNANFMKGVNAQNITNICSKIWHKDLLVKSGAQEKTIEMIQTDLSYAEEAEGDMNMTGYILGIVMVLVMFFAVYYYGYGVSMSVASEKTSRVMETLVISAKPSRILIGKCLAMGVLGLLQLTGILLFAFICYTLLVPQNFSLGGMALDFSTITPVNVVILLAYFILGYALYAVLNSVCGAAVSKIEDLNSAMMPVSMISIGGFYLGYFTAIAGGGSSVLSKIAMYLPFSSPFSVPFTLLTGGMETMDLIISLLLLVVFIVGIASVSIRVYSASVLHYGNKLKIKELLRMR